ncbi:MAG: outer membrane protein transport protein [Candidatus Thiodiazotropha sp. (ex Semelilucina semeliformis)]|nr:outer membrane protein transport protein [Candidatus Thiodiazotropha sp. (ex Semelilucina semeliformis)]
MQLKKTFQLSRLALSCGIAMLAMNQSVQASGFAVPELNITGLALSNALVANPDSLAAIAYNPAAMSFHEGSSVAAGALLVKPDLSVTTSGAGSVDSEANDIVGIPTLSAHTKLTETWSIGISVNAPFGLETEWPAGTFDSQYPPGSTIPTQSKLEIVAFSPSVAYKINDNVSVAGGVDYYWMREVIFDGDVNNPLGPNPAADLEGDGRGVGLNLGLIVDQGNWSFGGSYHSEANIPIEGTVDLPAGALPTFFSNNVHADLKLPYRLQVGVRNQTTDKLAIEFDITRTGWSSFDKLVVDHDQYGVNIVTSDNNWDDANAYRLGATYDISQATQLRIGYTFDETPQDDAFFSPRIPDSDRQLFSFGLGHTLGNGWTIDAGYMYVKFDERTINSTTAAVAGQETNGTTAVNGTYDSSVHLLGLGVTKHFM